VRAFHPWPGSQARLRGKTLKVLRARVAPGEAPSAAPGTWLSVDQTGVTVACGEGTALLVREVQPESRRAMDAFAFATGARLTAGTRFDS
jgi:methionyl-tRNA formyltransferase